MAERCTCTLVEDNADEFCEVGTEQFYLGLTYIKCNSPI